MDERLQDLRVNSERLRRDFNQLARIGATMEGGVHRPALSEAHLAARAWFCERIQRDGFTCRVDGAGNHSAVLSCGPEGAATLLLGSHLDSVPHGGRFDGPLGVLAALETLRVVQETGTKLPVHLEAIDFTDEEGTLVGELGSAALAGSLSEKELAEPRGGRPALEEGLARAGLTERGILSAKRQPETLLGYLELHIEQGKRLLEVGAQIGVVTSIVGIGSCRLRFIGRADHAGTTPADERLDAAMGASAFALAAHQELLNFPGCTVNIGDMRFAPGAFNIVPAEVTVSLEYRAPDPAELTRLETALLARAGAAAVQHGLALEVEPAGRVEPALMSQQAQTAIEAAARSLGLRHLPLSSLAGHDGQALAAICPVGMVFVPSQDGASHSPREYTRWEDCRNGANVLLQAAIRWATGQLG